MLAVRTVRFYVRNPELVLAKLFTYIFMGCFMGAHARLLLGTSSLTLSEAQLQIYSSSSVCARHAGSFYMVAPERQAAFDARLSFDCDGKVHQSYMVLSITFLEALDRLSSESI